MRSLILGHLMISSGMMIAREQAARAHRILMIELILFIYSTYKQPDSLP
jgi:hypothetical protein